MEQGLAPWQRPPRPEPQDGQHTTPKHREKADGTSPGPQPHCNLTESYPNVTVGGPRIRGAPTKDTRQEATAPGAHWVPPTSLSPHCQTPGTPRWQGPKPASTRVSNHSHPNHGCALRTSPGGGSLCNSTPPLDSETTRDPSRQTRVPIFSNAVARKMARGKVACRPHSDHDQRAPPRVRGTENARSTT